MCILNILYIEQMQSKREEESSQLWIFKAEVKVFSTNKHTVAMTSICSARLTYTQCLKPTTVSKCMLTFSSSINTVVTDTLTYAAEEREWER